MLMTILILMLMTIFILMLPLLVLFMLPLFIMLMTILILMLMTVIILVPVSVAGVGKRVQELRRLEQVHTVRRRGGQNVDHALFQQQAVGHHQIGVL